MSRVQKIFPHAVFDTRALWFVSSILHLQQHKCAARVVTTLRAGRSGARIPARTNILLHYKSPDRLWGPPSLLFSGYRGFIPGLKRPGREVVCFPPNLAPRFKMSGAVTLLRLALSWRKQRQPYFAGIVTLKSPN